jgi:TolB-like protein/DNA-binding winged helix-turn-helix (wHTH) protein/Flp pilus assembly protein TadD
VTKIDDARRNRRRLAPAFAAALRQGRAALDESPPNPPDPPERVRFAGFTLDLQRHALFDASGQAVELRPQAQEVLHLLASKAGQLVTKQELLAAVWPQVVVTEDSLVQAIGDVRHALGDAGHRVIRTISRRGYRLVADAPPPATDPAPPPGAASQERRWGKRAGWAFAALAGMAVLGAGLLMARLQWPGPDADGTPLARKPSIAVLPFKAPPDQADGGVLAQDVAAELVAELARSPGLRVVSTQSSFQFDVARTPLAEIGRALRSRYIVDGSVRRVGERLRIAVQLLDSQDGQLVWSASHWADPSTLAAAQQALVGRVAGTLQSRVSRTEERRALARPAKSLDVIVLTAHGKAMMQRYSAQGMREARRLLQQALALDPQHAPAWAYLGMTDTIDIGLRLTGEWDQRRAGEMLAHVQRAITLQPDLTVAYVALSQAHGLIGNFDDALGAAQECFRLSPYEAGCFYVLGATQLRMGDAKAAEGNLAQALDRNPLPPAFLTAFYATALWADGRQEEALRIAGDCLAKAPDFFRCRQDRIAALVELGRGDEARQEGARLLAQLPGMTARQFGAGFADSALALRQRRIAAALQAGLPMDSAHAGVR